MINQIKIVAQINRLGVSAEILETGEIEIRFQSRCFRVTVTDARYLMLDLRDSNVEEATTRFAYAYAREEVIVPEM